MLPNSICQRSTTWAGVRPCSAAIRVMNPVAEDLALAERRPRLGGDALAREEGAQRCLGETGVQLHLVEHGDHLGLGPQAPYLLLGEVREPDRPDPAVVVQLLEGAPGLHVVVLDGQRPMDEVEVDNVEPQPLGAALERRQRPAEAVVGVPELGGDEQLVAGDAAVGDGLADAFLVAVGGRGVNEAVPGFEGQGDRLIDLIGGDLEDAEASWGISTPLLRVIIGGCAMAVPFSKTTVVALPLRRVA